MTSEQKPKHCCLTIPETAKKQLAEQVVGAGEDWLTEMDTDQLRNLLILDRNAVIEEDEV